MLCVREFLETAQIFDTVELYFLPGKRWLSLKFLAREVLGMAVQTENHDAIEDARTALSLYMRYQEMQDNGTFPQVCERDCVVLCFSIRFPVVHVACRIDLLVCPGVT